MKKILAFITTIFLFFGFVLESFAIDAPSNLKVDSSTNSSVVLSWDVLADAYMYSVYYWKKSLVWTSSGTYDNQTEYVEWNTVEIKDLDSWVYYFSVVALNDLWDESTFWKELMFDTSSDPITGAASSSFVLKSINVVSLNWVELTFSAPIEDVENAVREFKIVNKADSLDAFNVVKTEVNPEDATKLLLTLDKDTNIWSEYEVTVTAIKSADAKNIEAWIDSTEVFMVNAADYPTEDVTYANFPVQLNAAGESLNVVTWSGETGSGVALLAAAETAEALPSTGPEQVILLLLSLIIWFGFFIVKLKRS